jgi:hypothetical protein
MKKIMTLIGAVSLTFLVGCGTNAHYVQTGGRDSVVSVGQINSQDFIQAAQVATSDLLASGVLDRVANPPAVIAISRIVNDTGAQIETDLLVKKIRVGLLQSHKAMTTTVIGLGGKVEDPLAKSLGDQTDFMADKQTIHKVDFILSGKIIELKAQAGNTSQSTYSFQLTLTDMGGLAVWEGEKEITKQGSRSVIGF